MKNSIGLFLTYNKQVINQFKKKSNKLNKYISFFFILIEVSFTGYYRVNYDDKTWDFIATALKNGNIHALNRAQVSE